jgi:hypothetical protein
MTIALALASRAYNSGVEPALPTFLKLRVLRPDPIDDVGNRRYVEIRRLAGAPVPVHKNSPGDKFRDPSGAKGSAT